MKILDFIRAKVLRKFIDLKHISQMQLNYDEIIRMELLVALCMIVSIVGLSYVVVALFLKSGFILVGTYLVFFLTTIPLILYLIRKGKYNESKSIMMFMGTIFMTMKASSLGPDSGMNLAMLIIVFAIFSFYSLDDYRYIILNLSFLSLCIIFLELTDYSYLGVETATQRFEYEFNLVFTILFCILFFYVILRVNQYINKKLKVLNNKLLLKNARLAKMNEELDGYVYKASHDIRAPLTSLMGIINLIKVEKDPEKIMQYIALQEKCIEKMDSHILQILDLSKNLKTGLYPSEINFQAIIDGIFLELNFFESAERVKKMVKVYQDTKFYSDPYRIQIILNNLISNAFKYSRNDIDVSRIEITVAVNKETALINVMDNGIGVAPDQKEKIFNMFYRGTDKSKGAGLGLYIVKQMIDKLKGKIAIKSEVNNYTNFSIELPNLFGSLEKKME